MEWKEANLGMSWYLKVNDEFYISYFDPRESLVNSYQTLNLDVNEIKKLMDDIEKAGTPMNKTAIIIPFSTEPEYLILKGDFRKEYEELIDQGLDACIQFYNKMREEHSSVLSSDSRREIFGEEGH